MSLVTNDAQQLLLNMMSAMQLADQRVAEENGKALDTFRQLFQEMQQTMEQQSAENAVLRLQLLASDTRNNEAERAHQAEVKVLKEQIEAAKSQAQGIEILHREQVAALQRQVEVIRREKDAANQTISRMTADVTTLKQQLDAATRPPVHHYRAASFHPFTRKRN